jgi:hypothetical protein
VRLKSRFNFYPTDALTLREFQLDAAVATKIPSRIFKRLILAETGGDEP